MVVLFLEGAGGGFVPLLVSLVVLFLSMVVVGWCVRWVVVVEGGGD